MHFVLSVVGVGVKTQACPRHTHAPIPISLPPIAPRIWYIQYRPPPPHPPSPPTHPTPPALARSQHTRVHAFGSDDTHIHYCTHRTHIPHIPPPYTHQAYDQHLNMILEDAEETVTVTDYDEETEEEVIAVRVHTMCCLLLGCVGGYARGIASPLNHSTTREGGTNFLVATISSLNRVFPFSHTPHTQTPSNSLSNSDTLSLSFSHFAYSQTSKRTIDMLFVRGDVVILVAPPLRTS